MTGEITTKFPVAPPSIMPEGAQTIFLVTTAIVTGLVIIAALRASRHTHAATPLLMVMSAFLAIPMEPVVAFLGHIVHPIEGQISFFSAVTRSIPWHMALGYTAGFGVYYLWLYAKLTQGTLTGDVFWRGVAVSIATYWFGEILPVHLGLWVYYDHQPLWLWHGSSPVTWSILNTTCMVTGATLMIVARPYLKGAAQLLLVPFGVIGVAMGHLGSGLPMYVAMNTDWPGWIIEVSGVLSVLFALMIVWLCGNLLREVKPWQA